MKKFLKQVYLNKHAEPRAGLMVVVTIVLTILGQIVAGLFLQDDDADVSITLKIIVTLIYSIITIGGGIYLFKIVFHKKISEVGIVGKWCFRNTIMGLILGIILMGIVFGVLILCGQTYIKDVNINRLFSVSLCVEFFSLCFMAFSEEFLFRGFMMTALKTTHNRKVIFLTSAILFSMMHLLNPGVTILSFINTFLGGLLFSYMFIHSGSLWLPFGFHVAWNFLQGDILGFNVSGNAESSVLLLSVGKLDILTGGKYGLEGGLLVTFVLLIGFIMTRFLLKPLGKDGWTMD